uniref:Schwannomin interacting protein 1 C-terminal domain-containing protein n=1 Tax=Trichobilharzia regenti TaxID=157069 RepID=A0AA85JHQ6_TRIRE|nr:unnamed protein product [Trichobilharzia regenti]
MLQSSSLEVFNSSSLSAKSRSAEGDKIHTYAKEKNSTLLDQIVTSSITSSGYWEDCDSLVTSEYDIFGVNWANSHHNERIKGLKTKHRSLTEGGIPLSLVRTRSFHARQGDATGRTSPFGEDFTTELHLSSNVNTGCYESQHSNVSQNSNSDSIRLSLGDNDGTDLQKNSLDEFDSITSDLLLCNKSYPSAQNIHPVPRVYDETRDTRRKIYTHFDEWDDSEEEEVFERKEPRTKFEAALRRAEEESKRRQALLAEKDYTIAGKLMPEWGSPIRTRTTANMDRLNQCSVVSDMPSTTKNSPRVGRSVDLCSEVEEWLQSRPSWIDRRHQENNLALQICFLNSSEQNLFSSMEAIISEPQVNTKIIQTETNSVTLPNNTTPVTTTTVTTATTNFTVIDATSTMDSDSDGLKQIVMNGDLSKSKHTNKEDIMNTSTTGRSSLFLAFESSVNLISLLNEIDMYYERLLDQCKHDCYNARSVVYLQELIRNHKRFQSETQIAVVQVPKISAMQAEVERMKIPSLSPNVAKLLRIDLKRFRMCKNELIKFSASQLEVIMNDLHARIEGLNDSLMLLLVERDDLHLEQGGKMVALEDIKSWIKELSIRSLIPQVRRQFFLNLPSNLSSSVYNDGLFPKSQTHHPLTKKPQWMTSLFGRVSQRQTLSL